MGPYLDLIDESRIYSNFGPLNNLLINRLADYFNVHTTSLVTVANATLGIQGAILTSGISNLEEWALPSWTFTATAAAVANSNVEPHFFDVDEEWRLKCDHEIKNMVDVLPFGLDLNLNRIPSSVQCIVVDGAASFDSLRNLSLPKDKKIAIIVSFHATKLLPGGEGGVFISNDEEWVTRFKSWTNFGFDKTRISKFIGTNAKLDEYSCAVALAALDEWPRVKNNYLHITKRALEISDRSKLTVHLAMQRGFVTPYWIVSSHREKIDFVLSKLQENNIPFRRWWEYGCSEMPAYANFKKENLENSKRIAECTIGLPFHAFLNNNDWHLLEKTLCN